MSRLLRHLAILAVAVTPLGCGMQTSENVSHNDELSARKREVAEEREKIIRTHHDRAVEEFVKTEGMGISRVVVTMHKATPMSLAMTLPGWAEEPTLDATGSVPAATLLPWFQEKVEMVSLLVNEKPGVYSLDKKGSPLGRRPTTRELDDFETAALQKLRDGDEIHVKDSHDNIRVLGAIRMQKACVSCHEKPEGTLLGAFSYVLKSGMPKVAPPPAPKAKSVESPLNRLIEDSKAP